VYGGSIKPTGICSSLAPRVAPSYLAAKMLPWKAAMNPLKLVALDKDDLEVVSAHLQDALVKPADIRWRPFEKRLVVGLSRFDWEAALGQTPEYRRRSAALRFDRVLSCKALDVDRSSKGAVLNLLTVAFDQRDPPAGIVTLTFSGGGTLRLEVECLEAEIVDLGLAWAAAACPDHSKVVN
jgi:hypothetical protein